MEQQQEQETKQEVSSQKDAVFGYALHVLGLDSATIPKASMTKEVKKQVKNLLIEGLNAGLVCKTSRVTPEKTAKLASGLVSNWIKKDERFV